LTEAETYFESWLLLDSHKRARHRWKAYGSSDSCHVWTSCREGRVERSTAAAVISSSSALRFGAALAPIARDAIISAGEYKSSTGKAELHIFIALTSLVGGRKIGLIVLTSGRVSNGSTGVVSRYISSDMSLSQNNLKTSRITYTVRCRYDRSCSNRTTGFFPFIAPRIRVGIHSITRFIST
jgi:hypothetical protein